MKSVFTATALLLALTACGDAITQKQTPKLSDYDSCLQLNKQFAELKVPLNDCERLKTYQTPQQRLATAGGKDRLIRNCEENIKPSLNDPDSYRYIGGRIVSTGEKMDVIVNYSANNGFGGRVRASLTCTVNS